MSEIFDYVSVNVSRETQAVTQEGFGTLLFLGTTDDGAGAPKQSEKIVEYGDMDEVSAVFSSGEPEYDAASAYFAQSPRPASIKIGFRADAESITEALDAIDLIDDDWYMLAHESRVQSDIINAAAAILTREKGHVAATSDSDAADSAVSTDVLSELLNGNYERTLCFFHKSAGSAYPEVALAGDVLTEDPGTETWAYRSLNGIPADSLTAAEKSAIEGKRGTYYVTTAGVNMTFESATSSAGMFMDFIRGGDWLRYRVAERIFGRLTSGSRIPYRGGSAVIESQMRAALDNAVERGVIARGYSVTVPPYTEQTAQDRSDRIVRNAKFNAEYVGAVHRAYIDGTLNA